MFKRILVAGGDERARRLALLLESEGYEVSTIGLISGDEKNADGYIAHVVLFPYPFSVKMGSVPTLTGLTLHPEDVLKTVPDDALIIAGDGLDAYVYAANAAGKRLVFKQYQQSESFLEANADLSAEASVAEAMKPLPVALFDMTALVIGYGFFGRAIAKRMQALGSTVWVAARREQQRLIALSDGMYATDIKGIASIAPGIQMVLNTVPSPVIDDDTLRCFSSDTCLLELASAPYGFDRDAAKRLGLHCEVLPALPARYAPQTAAKALKKIVIQLLSEEII